jgi:hypothetical protein
VSRWSWDYIAADQFKSTASIIAALVDIVMQNGTLLVDMGPRSEGTIPDEARKILTEMGAWLATNSEAISARGRGRYMARIPPRRPRAPSTTPVAARSRLKTSASPARVDPLRRRPRSAPNRKLLIKSREAACQKGGVAWIQPETEVVANAGRLAHRPAR